MIQNKILIQSLGIVLICTLIPSNSVNGISTDALGDVDKTITLTIGPADIAYLDGSIWAVDLNSDFLYKLNPTTGAEVLRFDMGFSAGGITSDGTNLIVSTYVQPWPTANGSFFVYSTGGELVDSFELPIDYASFLGLAFDGTNIWASQVNPDRIVSIDPNTKLIVANHSVSNNLAGLTYFDNALWGVAYGQGEVYKIDPSDGSTIDIFDTPAAGDWGIATDGNTLLISDFTAQKIYFMDGEVELGEIYNAYSSVATVPYDLAVNDTHVFVADGSTDQILVLDSGNYSEV
ncbi:MAG: Vgb family protein, partial [Candidatus Kariarchaeaceae archaeon]